MARKSTSPIDKAKGLISTLFTLKKIPFLVVIIVIVLVIFFIAPFTLLFSNNGMSSSRPISELGAAEIPQEYIPIYQAAEKKYNVPWNILAGVHRVETRFGTLKPMVSPVGALGHMQFMCRTWVGWSIPGTSLGACADSVDYTSTSLISNHGGYGVDANGDGKSDPFNPHDAIFTAAKYLAANGAASGKIEKALLAYNHSTEYVQDVVQFAQSYIMSPSMSPDGSFVVDVGDSGFAWPATCTKNVTSSMAMRVHPVTGKISQHKGADITAAGCNKTPVISALTGRVSFAGRNGTYGNLVKVEHGNGLETRYAHLAGITVRPGQVIKQGQVVGLLGTTGRSTGPHLHYEVRINGVAHDPLKFY